MKWLVLTTITLVNGMQLFVKIIQCPAKSVTRKISSPNSSFDVVQLINSRLLWSDALYDRKLRRQHYGEITYIEKTAITSRLYF